MPTQKPSNLCCRHAQGRSYAKGVQQIEKLDKATDSQPNPESDATTASSEEDLSDADYKQVRTWTERALRQEPLNARGLRILGQIAEQASDYQKTNAFMHAAAQKAMLIFG